MKQVVIRGGNAVVDQVPAPQVEPGTILVEVDHSCVSIGTEMAGVKSSGLPLWKRAMQQPENVKKVLEMVSSQGIARTKSLVEGKLAAGNPTGYSASGTVIAVGENVENFKVGDRVACAGAQCAHHAEVIRVPKNLAVLIPEDLSFAYASTVTLGAIALQGVRRAQPTLGESFVVIGLGILGQITVQLLKANGCRVIGTDLDKNRIELAKTLGMDVGIHPAEGSNIESVFRLTDGYGADGVIITAASQSDEIISTAFKMCRKKGRVVLVGDVGLDLNRADFYAKEIDFFISTSYGPGRYDNLYEEKGLEYPLPYVRWTETRNMSQYLHLCAEKKVSLEPLISKTYPIDQASEAYEDLKRNASSSLMVLLKYSPSTIETNKLSTKVQTKATGLKSDKSKIGVALVGAGGFAKGMHLPNFQKLHKHYALKAVVSRTGHNAVATAKQFLADYSSTDIEDVLKDPDIDLVVIATRHDLHAELAIRALKSNKHVLLEKPLSVNETGLEEIIQYFNNRTTSSILLTGFNRRFSPHINKIKEALKSKTSPIIMNYRMNAGYLPLDHWVHGPEGGGRNIGEACHIYDLFTYLTDSEYQSVKISSIRSKTSHYSYSDNFVASIEFKDGSVGNLIYTALGSKDYPKEHLEVYFDGKVLKLEDYKSLTGYGFKFNSFNTSTHEKGQLEEVEALADAIKNGGEWPIPLWQQIQATQISFEVEKQLPF